MSVIVGIFESQEAASEAVDRLDGLEIDEGDIHVLTRNEMETNRGLLGDLANAFSAGTTPVENVLTRLGLSSEEAAFYEEELGDESVLVAVKSDDDMDAQVSAVFREANGVVRS